MDLIRQVGFEDGLWFASKCLGMGWDGYYRFLAEWKRQQEEYERQVPQPMAKPKSRYVRLRKVVSNELADDH